MKKNKDKIPDNKLGIVVFVEGETDNIFYDKIIKYMINSNKEQTVIETIIIKNVKGIGNYSKKAPNIFKNDYVVNNPDTKFVVFCAYDNDVFKYSVKPPINWTDVEAKLKEYGAVDVKHIVAKEMIEDWFLLNIRGLCDYLKIDEIPEIKGKTGEDKMKNYSAEKTRFLLKAVTVITFWTSLILVYIIIS